jgi:hypothetical protein
MDGVPRGHLAGSLELRAAAEARNETDPTIKRSLANKKIHQTDVKIVR